MIRGSGTFPWELSGEIQSIPEAFLATTNEIFESGEEIIDPVSTHDFQKYSVIETFTTIAQYQWNTAAHLFVEIKDDIYFRRLTKEIGKKRPFKMGFSYSSSRPECSVQTFPASFCKVEGEYMGSSGLISYLNSSFTVKNIKVKIFANTKVEWFGQSDFIIKLNNSWLSLQQDGEKILSLFKVDPFDLVVSSLRALGQRMPVLYGALLGEFNGEDIIAVMMRNIHGTFFCYVYKVEREGIVFKNSIRPTCGDRVNHNPEDIPKFKIWRTLMDAMGIKFEV